MLIAPSLLSADPLHLDSELHSMEQAGADWHHVDVMDGHFVPNLTFGLPLIKRLKQVTKLPLDVHLMISNPDEVLHQYIDAGADILTFHVEAAVQHHRLLASVRERACKAGLALNPGTPLSALEALLPSVDLILVLSVNPGFSGQAFIPESVERVRALRALLQTRGLAERVIIEVDGGVDANTVGPLVAAGATALVSGSYLYGAKDRAQALARLRA